MTFFYASTTVRKMESRLPIILLLISTLFMCSGASVFSSYTCPQECLCQTSMNVKNVVVDCSNRGLRSIPRNLDPSIIHLDLSNNLIEKIPAGAFDGHGALSTLLLNDNRISVIDAHALRGLVNLHVLDLQRNTLRIIDTDAFSGIHAALDCSSSNPCLIDFQENPIRRIKSYALSWCKGLSLMFGNSDTELDIEPYAFYGCQEILRIQIRNVPSVRLQPRVFTNTDLVRSLEISNTNVKIIEGFTFEGLRNAQEIQFRNCHFGAIESFGFSGILYQPSTLSQETAYSDKSQRAGGILNISGSTLHKLPTDAFRETNLENLIINNNTIDIIHANAFRGLHSLALLQITSNEINEVKPLAFGGLKNVLHVILGDNNLSQLTSGVFKDSKGIEKLHVHVRRNTSLTLQAYSFSGLRDVGELDIRGAPGSIINVDRDAFHDLGGVTTLQIANVSLPIVGQHTFRGLNKVQILRLEYCNISRIDNLAFGGPTGAVATLELKEGNNMPCDCETNKVLQEFENRFAMFTASCVSATSERQVLTPYTFNWPSCSDSGSGVNRIVPAIVLLSYLAVALLQS